jgi:hypothetical protein
MKAAVALTKPHVHLMLAPPTPEAVPDVGLAH